MTKKGRTQEGRDVKEERQLADYVFKMVESQIRYIAVQAILLFVLREDMLYVIPENTTCLWPVYTGSSQPRSQEGHHEL